MSQSLFFNKSYNSVNFNDRPIGIKIDTIIIHFTEVDFETSIKLLTQDVGHKVSSHFLIDYEGEMFALVDEKKRARHAGDSYWKGRTAINDFSIGIEILNDGQEPYKEEQIIKLIELLNYLKDKYNILDKNILGHSDIAPNRKVDPGAHFPWKLLNENGIGIYHNVDLQDDNKLLFQLGDETDEIFSIKRNLHDIGYNIDLKSNLYDENMKNVVLALQMHFYPENVTGFIDENTLSIINNLKMQI